MRSYVFVLTQAVQKIGKWEEKVEQMPFAYATDV